MKCPKCQREVEKGSLYCPYCLEEVPWVKEFDSVETLLKKEEQRRPQTKEQEDQKNVDRWFGRKQVIYLFLVAMVFLGAFFYRCSNSFAQLYSRAQRQYEQQDYEKAEKIVARALEKEPHSEKANILMSRIMDAQGDLSSAILILRPMLKNKTAGIEVYQELVMLLTKDGQTQEVKQILEQSSLKVQSACKDYICETPVTNLTSGTYTLSETVELTADCDKIYYTLDGSDPDRNSSVYTGPIVLQEGTTVLKAFGVNEKGIESDLIERKYVIVLRTPDAPKVVPESGDYDKKTKIKVTVPDGCKAYYAFDSQPDVNSTLYEQPISMPQGYHQLHVILVAANGKISDVTTREYYLQY